MIGGIVVPSKSPEKCAAVRKAASSLQTGVVGYIRVSTEDQNPQLQYDAMDATGLNKEDIFYDVESGTVKDRVGYADIIYYVKRGLVKKVLVWKMDRLGRDPKEVLNFFWLCDEHGVEVESLTEPFVANRTKTPGDFLIWWISVGLSVFELLTLRVRQRAGIDSKKEAVKKGKDIWKGRGPDKKPRRSNV